MKSALRFAASLAALCLFAFSVFPCPTVAAPVDDDPGALANYKPAIDPSFDLRDYHVHLDQGLSVADVVKRAKLSGVKAGVLVNFGRDWPISSNEQLAQFVDEAEKTNASLPESERLKIGVQVNDRDWTETLDPKIYERLDYILADTLIMGTREDGSPGFLWDLPKDYDEDKDEWFAKYYAHCLEVASEPIDILANPTWLPEFIASDYDRLWTKERMAVLIQTAIDGGVAIEIQAESPFQKPQFVELAQKMGAKFTFGSNNLDSRLVNTDAWKKNFERFHFTKDQLWRDYRYDGKAPKRAKPGVKRTVDYARTVERLKAKGVL